MTIELLAADAAAIDLDVLAASSLDPLFWSPEGPQEAPAYWEAHVPFAHWLVVALRPSVIVDIGPDSSASYAAFRRAAARAGIDARCHALRPLATEASLQERRDGKDHRSDILPDAETAGHAIADHTVGLLHLDLFTGMQITGRAVEAWIAKLSDEAILLLHGIRGYSDHSDCRRVWDALAGQHPHFEFTHGGSLGVLAIGEHVPRSVEALCNLTGSAAAERIRERFAALGANWEYAARAAWQAQERHRQESAVQALEQENARARARSLEEERARAQMAFRLTVARRDVYAASLRADEAAAMVAGVEARAVAAEARAGKAVEAARLASDLQEHTLRERDAILNSRTWRATGPVRRLAGRHPGLARLVWRSMRLAWWSLSLQLPARYRERRRRPPGMALPHGHADTQEGSAVGVTAPASESTSGIGTATAHPAIGAGCVSAAPEQAGGEDKRAEQELQAHIDLLDFLASERRITFASAPDPELSVILALDHDAGSALRSLTSLRTDATPRCELIVLRQPGSERIDALLARCEPVRVIDDAGGGYPLRALNRGAASARGRVLLFLDGTAVMRPGALAAGLATLDAASDVGAVGGRLVGPSGNLWAAGGIVWSDASLGRYGCDLPAEASEAMFRREADFSTLPLLVSQAAWRRAGDFDATFRLPAHGLADHAIRLRDAGLRVVYEPGFTADRDGDPEPVRRSVNAEDASRDSHVRFRSRHHVILRLAQLPPTQANTLFAREPRRAARRRLLMIDNEVPFGSLGSGYPRAQEMLAVAAAANWAITLFPLHRPDFDWSAARAELAPELEIIAGRGAAGLAAFLQERTGFYDLILVSRPDNMELAHNAFRELPRSLGGARLVYDAEAVFAYREVIRADWRDGPTRPRMWRSSAARKPARQWVWTRLPASATPKPSSSVSARKRLSTWSIIRSFRVRTSPDLRRVRDSCSSAACWSQPLQTGWD